MSTGGCFGPTSTVTRLVDTVPHTVSISQVQPGDVVLCANGATATVQCVVASPRSPSVPLRSLPNGLTLTSKHPVYVNGVWALPETVGSPAPLPSPTLVFNLVLDHTHVILVNNTPAVTLGHGLEGPVVGHTYWGTRRVIDDLQTLPGWEQGRVFAQWFLTERGPCLVGSGME